MSIAVSITGPFKKASRALNKAVESALYKAGAYYRSAIQRSMRWATIGKRYKPSQPGQSPKAIRGRGQLRRFITYEVNAAKRTVEIGPKKLGKGFVPVLHELGGTVQRHRVKMGQKAQIDTRKGRPVIIRIKTQKQAARATGLLRPARYPARPYVSTAVKEHGAKVNSLFFDTFKKQFEKKLN